MIFKMRKNLTDRQTDRQWIFICFVLIAWVIFLFLKINGKFDFSAKYDIEQISCNEEYNRLLLIDGDSKTTWGMLDRNHTKGEQINFRFRHPRYFSKIFILNTTTDETKPMNIYVSSDGENFEQCIHSLNINTDKGHEFSLLQQYYGQYLRLEYTSDVAGTWPITEVEISEVSVEEMPKSAMDDVFCPEDNKFSLSDGLEDWNQGPFAWTSRDFGTKIYNKQINDTGLVIKMKTELSRYMTQNPELNPYLHIYVDDMLVQKVAVTDEYINLNISMTDHDSDIYDIKLKTNCYFNPKDVGINDDTRNLSIAVYYIGN